MLLNIKELFTKKTINHIIYNKYLLPIPHSVHSCSMQVCCLDRDVINYVQIMNKLFDFIHIN